MDIVLSTGIHYHKEIGMKRYAVTLTLLCVALAYAGEKADACSDKKVGAACVAGGKPGACESNEDGVFACYAVHTQVKVPPSPPTPAPTKGWKVTFWR
jgi:hypothetical protein